MFDYTHVKLSESPQLGSLRPSSSVQIVFKRVFKKRVTDVAAKCAHTHCASNEPLSTEVTHVSLKELSERKQGHGHPRPP